MLNEVFNNMKLLLLFNNIDKEMYFLILFNLIFN